MTSSYLFCGQANLHKSNIVGGDFVRYLNDGQMNYKLDIDGQVTGMNHYYQISQEARQEQLDRLAMEKENRPKLKTKPKNAHTSKLTSEAVQKAKEDIPDILESKLSIDDLWNKDFMDSLMPFSNVEEADGSMNPDFITVNGNKIDLSQLSKTDRAETISRWQTL